MTPKWFETVEKIWALIGTVIVVLGLGTALPPEVIKLFGQEGQQVVLGSIEIIIGAAVTVIQFFRKGEPELLVAAANADAATIGKVNAQNAATIRTTKKNYIFPWTYVSFKQAA